MNPVLYFVVDDSLIKTNKKGGCTIRVNTEPKVNHYGMNEYGNLSVCHKSFKTVREAIQFIKKFYNVRKHKQFCWYEEEEKYHCFVGTKKIKDE